MLWRRAVCGSMALALLAVTGACGSNSKGGSLSAADATEAVTATPGTESTVAETDTPTTETPMTEAATTTEPPC